MKNDKTEKAIVTKTTEKMILEKTPRQFVKSRVGRGGKRLDYVETGYIINKLNQVFNYMWSFEVIEDKIGESQVYVKGKLTAHLPNGISITKVQYGGKDIAKDRTTQKPVDIGDDMKAASSDALKKCASLFGIAQDIFWPTGNELLEEPENTTPKPLSPREMAEKKEEDGYIREPVEESVAPTTGSQGYYQEMGDNDLKLRIAQLMNQGKIAKDFAGLNKMSRIERIALLQKAA